MRILFGGVPLPIHQRLLDGKHLPVQYQGFFAADEAHNNKGIPDFEGYPASVTGIGIERN